VPAAPADAASAPGTGNATTPQGLVAQVAQGPAGSDYQKVVLALSDAPVGRAPEMAFIDLQAPLQALFQANQLFAVVVNPQWLGTLLDGSAAADLSTPAFENNVTIAGWSMTARVGQGVLATDYRNVMLFKFGGGTVQERVRNPNGWVGAQDFSLAAGTDTALGAAGLSAWLQDYVAAGVAEANEGGNPLYANFARIVTDPSWNGILVLRAEVDPTDFPPQIQGLAAGIDPTAFEAHHFGVTASRVQAAEGVLRLQSPSSLFGLIDYQLPPFRQNLASGGNPDVPIAVPVQGDFGFTVLQLQALFQNAALVDFRSRVQLTVNRLFGSVVTAAWATMGGGARIPAPANAVVLRGSYVTQGATSTYVFQQDQPTVFLLDGNVLPAVAFNRVQFNTLTPVAGDTALHSRFLVWGTFDFAALQATPSDAPPLTVDVLSFGSPPATPPAQLGQGLAFSNLQIDLTSPAANPGAVAFSFNPGAIAVDVAASQARDGSLFRGFALQLDSFVAPPAGKRPSDLGFLPVGVDPPLAALSGAWYGVVYKVTMGTAGALASAVGFESRLLLAWSPQTAARAASYAAFVGLQLPGAAPGAKMLSLQGVLRVTVDSLRLQYEPVAGSGERGFTLRLNDVGLTFLGVAKLPPGATIDFFLFGPPGGTGSVGWYAAYVKDPAPPPAPAQPALPGAALPGAHDAKPASTTAGGAATAGKEP